MATLNYEIHTGPSAMELYYSVIQGASAAVHTGSWEDINGRTHDVRKKTRAAWIGIVLTQNAATETWIMEKVMGGVVYGGRIKLS